MFWPGICSQDSQNTLAPTHPHTIARVSLCIFGDFVHIYQNGHASYYPQKTRLYGTVNILRVPQKYLFPRSEPTLEWVSPHT